MEIIMHAAYLCMLIIYTNYLISIVRWHNV